MPRSGSRRSSRSARSVRPPPRSSVPASPPSPIRDNQEALVEALGAAADGESVRLLTSLVVDQGRSEPVRAAALDALARFRGPDVLRARLSLLYDPRAPETLVARALPSLGPGRHPSAQRPGRLPGKPLASGSSLGADGLNVKKALPPEIKELVLARLDDPSADVRQAAVLAAGALQLREAIPRLVQAAGKPDAELRALAISALCRMPDPRAAAIYRQASTDSDPSLRRAGAQALQAIGGAVDPDVARAGATRPGLTDAAALARFAQSHPGDPRREKSSSSGQVPRLRPMPRRQRPGDGPARAGPEWAGPEVG